MPEAVLAPGPASEIGRSAEWLVRKPGPQLRGPTGVVDVVGALAVPCGEGSPLLGGVWSKAAGSFKVGSRKTPSW